VLAVGIVLAIGVSRMTSSLKNEIESYERREIVRTLNECGWVKADAARKLGITERMIGYKIKKYEIQKEAMERQ
jgi:Nif-specific regulatory protein